MKLKGAYNIEFTNYEVISWSFQAREMSSVKTFIAQDKKLEPPREINRKSYREKLPILNFAKDHSVFRMEIKIDMLRVFNRSGENDPEMKTTNLIAKWANTRFEDAPKNWYHFLEVSTQRAGSEIRTITLPQACVIDFEEEITEIPFSWTATIFVAQKIDLSDMVMVNGVAHGARQPMPMNFLASKTIPTLSDEGLARHLNRGVRKALEGLEPALRVEAARQAREYWNSSGMGVFEGHRNVYAIAETYRGAANFMTRERREANAIYIYHFLSERGWTRNAIAGLLGNIEKESGLNPGAWENLNVIEGRTSGYGLLQFTPATDFLEDRTAEWANDLAENNPKQLMDLQLELIIRNMQPGAGFWFHLGVWEAAIEFRGPSDRGPTRMTYQEYIESTRNAGDLALLLHAIFIRSADHQPNNQPRGGQSLQDRIEWADYWYNFLNEL